MIIDLDCGGGVTGFKYCKDNSPGTVCDDAPNPDLCYNYDIDHGDCGANWNKNATYGTIDLGLETVTIKINDDKDHILEDTYANDAGLQIGIDPHTVNDELTVCYTLSKPSNHIVFDIADLDYKKSGSKQQEKVCVYGTLGANQTPVFPVVTSLDGHVNITDNCGVGTTNSAQSHDDESILVEFTECVDKITIVYGTGSQSPTHNPDYSKIVIGESVFMIEQCKEGCSEPCIASNDSDNDGVCDNEDKCPGYDDHIDTDGDGIADGCDNNSREGLTKASLKLYPNPVYGSKNVTIEIDTEISGNAQFILLDATGRVYSSENIQLENDLTIHQISTAQLAAGIYFIQLQTQDWQQIYDMKLVVVKP